MILSLITASFLLGPASAQKAPTSQTLVKEALGYRKLVLLHKELREMDKAAAQMCAPASTAFGPHLAFMRNYVSPGALVKPLPKTGQLNLPIGTLIVKEKFEGKEDKEPTLITAMKKVKKGFGAAAWAFVMVDMKTRREVTDPKKPCLSCHERWAANDGVSERGAALLRSYTQTARS